MHCECNFVGCPTCGERKQNRKTRELLHQSRTEALLLRDDVLKLKLELERKNKILDLMGQLLAVNEME